MSYARDEHALFFPFPKPPEAGKITRIRSDLLWARIPLPFRLDHVNVYFLKDGNGWAVLNTGIDNAQTREIWEVLLSGPLEGQRLTKVVMSHHHPDHIGLAGWLCARFGIPMLTSQSAYLGCMTTSINPEILSGQHYREFYARHGMGAETTERVCSDGHRYLEKVSPLPPTFSRVVYGDVLTIGQRSFEVMTFDGHSNEQIVLYCAAENLLLAADQIIARISPNVSVHPLDPDGDPLGLFLRSLDTLTRRIPGDVLVLPGHQLPFLGLPERCRAPTQHHAERCDLIEGACRVQPHSVAELVPLLFTRGIVRFSSIGA